MGPAVGGALLLAFGANLGILINAALYLPFIIWLASAPYGPKFRTVGTVVAQRAVRGFGDIVHALREIAQHRVIAAMTVLAGAARSEEHTSELQSLMRISYAVFCLKKKKTHQYLNSRC